MNLGLAAFKLSFELSPIVLTNGIAKRIPGGMLPIIALTESLNFVDGLLTGGDPIDMDNFFAHFQPIPGASLIDQQLGTYPFANQGVAANAVITQPLTVSMLMICPVKGELGYAVKLATMIALQATIAQHNATGGTFTVATPTRYYTNCILKSLKDVTASESNQPQTMWQWDFEQPLLTQNQIQQAQNSLMSKLTEGTAVEGDPAWSGISNTVGNTSSLAAASILPSAGGAGGAGVSGALSSGGGS